MLKPDAIPTIFPNHPSHLQPPEPKKRRVLIREEMTAAKSPPASPPPNSSQQQIAEAEPPVSTPVYEELLETESAASQPTTTPKRGRPKVSPELKIPHLQRRIKTLRQRVRRLEKKARVQRNLLGILEKENKLHCAKLDVIDGVLGELVQNEALNKGKKTKSSYSDEIKRFAITIHYYSPKAYRYLCNNFSLPSTRSIRRWFETVNCEPGFLVDVIKSVKADGKPYSLVLDSMSIRKRLIVNKHTNHVEGRVTIGSDMEKMATELLVFLLVPLLGGPKHPIGYFLVDKIDSNVQQQLITQCLTLTAEHGIKIVNITCDGARSNVLTLEKLGAKIPSEPYFKHPTKDHKVYTTLDAVHMLKLARNAFGSLKRFKSDEGEIDFSFVEKLNKLQESMGVRLANKLSNRHMKWHNMKMKVRLAAQLLSSSVADAIEYLSKTDSKFKNSSPTITFIRNVRIHCHVFCVYCNQV